MVNMTDEHKWQTLMSINEKACKGINALGDYPEERQTEVNDGRIQQYVMFTKSELYLIAELTGNEATILKRKAEAKERAEYERLKAKFEGKV